jgi:serine/threonine protein kinase
MGAADRESQVSECVRQRPHPCVVTVCDVVEAQQWRLLFIVMEFCPGPCQEIGCDLFGAIKYYARASPSGVAPLAEVKNWIAEVFLGLEHLHLRMRAMIRDLKHGNVVLTAEGQAKLADFGLGRLDVCTQNREWTFGSPPGTPGWAAPEIFKNIAYTFTCDFYSLGVLVWVLLTGGENGHPPHHPLTRNNNYDVHQNDHLLLKRCIDRPRENNMRSIPAGPARELVERLLAQRMIERGTHQDIRSHEFLSGTNLPNFMAAPVDVATWASSHAARVASISQASAGVAEPT